MINQGTRAFPVAVFLVWVIASHAGADVGTPADRLDSLRTQSIERFDLRPLRDFVYRLVEGEDQRGQTVASPRQYHGRRVGSALSPDLGVGAGESIATTWDDHQAYRPVGRHISHYWNGEAGVDLNVGVHFVYEQSDDSLPDYYTGVPNIKTGYNVYVASVPSDNWPRGQDLGCRLQGADSIGAGTGANLAVRPGGLVTIVADSRFFAEELGDGSFYEDNIVYFQGVLNNCTYDPRSGLNTSFVDSTGFMPFWLGNSAGDYSRFPIIATQIDGSGNTVTHLVLAEEKFSIFDGEGDYHDDLAVYRAVAHFRKVGEGASGSWNSGQMIDTVAWSAYTDIAVDPWSGRVSVAYINPSIYGAFYNNWPDRDLWYRESIDYGLTWNPRVNATNIMNAWPDTTHLRSGAEVRALYSSDGNLHILFQSSPASADPYNDGFHWFDFNSDVMHWDRNSGHYVKVANGTFMDDDYLGGSINRLHCGFSGRAAYTQYMNISECDGKLFAIWNQFHSWANDGDYLNPELGLLSDCANTGGVSPASSNPANMEIMMSVGFIESSTLWDRARHVTNTFTPDCGLPGDPEATGGRCGSEYKPFVEPYALDESGMDLYWPEATKVDLTPEGEGSYGGGFYLNAQYLDDQYPGAAWSPWLLSDGIYVLNSMKWLRIACVEPVEGSEIDVKPKMIGWPNWVKLGQSSNLPLTVINEGNVVLNVTEIGYDDGGDGWLSVSENPNPGDPFQVSAGVVHTATFDAIVDASALSEPTWLEGQIWLRSDAYNSDSVAVNFRVLAADTVEPVMWDTVLTHANMFEDYFDPEGECVALAIGNNGELGYRAGGTGSVNLDYMESGSECGPRSRDAIYLVGATAFTILAVDSQGTDATLTQVFRDEDQVDETGFDPTADRGSITGGLSGTGDYDSSYTGRFVNRDTTIAMERTLYGPRSSDPTNDIINFMILYTKVYSGDGLAHDHVTLGNVADWDVPAEFWMLSLNHADASGSGFIYIQGTDTTGSESCQLNTGRFATEAFGGGYTSAEWESDNCVNGADFHSFTVLRQDLMNDTTHYRDGTPLVPDQPNPLVWWEETSSPGLNAVAMLQDQAVWFAYKHDYNLGAEDTLHYWTVLSTVRDGTLADLESQVAYAKCWYLETVRGCTCGCCDGRVGDANGLGTDEPTIGDVSVMIDAKFISGVCEGTIACLTEADINQSGGTDPTCDDVTIGDISYLIDYLFITGPSLGLAECL